MITKISTKDMSREQWLAARNNAIGGSDSAAVLGLNQYKSAYALWAEKTGKVVPEDISDREAVRLGNDLEQYVSIRWSEATGKKFRRENNILYNSEYPFAHANPDRMVVGESAGLECKTTSSFEIAKQVRDGNIPNHWLCQCVHYIAVTGCKRWYLAVLVFGVGFFHFTIERNDGEIAALMGARASSGGGGGSSGGGSSGGNEKSSLASIEKKAQTFTDNKKLYNYLGDQWSAGAITEAQWQQIYEKYAKSLRQDYKYASKATLGIK